MRRASVAYEAFARLLLVASLLGGVVHAAFAWLFFQHGVTPLGWINIGSVLIYVLASAWIQRDRLGWGLSLMGVEVIGHAMFWLAGSVEVEQRRTLGQQAFDKSFDHVAGIGQSPLHHIGISVCHGNESDFFSWFGLAFPDFAKLRHVRNLPDKS